MGVHSVPGGLSSALLRLRTFAALRHREFRLLWAGQAATAMAMWMDQVVRGWLMYELTNSPVQLGLVHGVQAIPILVLSPLAGSVADRYPRKQQVVVAQVLAGVMYAVLALLIITGRIRPWHVYATAFGMAIVQTFHQPARAAMVADAVPPYHLTNAIGLASVVFNVARSTGPALAGVLIATLGTASCYAVQAGFYLVAIVWTLQLRPTPSAAISGRAAPGASFGQSIIEGWTFSWRTETVRTGLLITMCASLFIMPFTTLLPVFARDLLGVGATGQGGLLTAMGLGALCSAVLLASLRGPAAAGAAHAGGRDGVWAQRRRLRGLVLVPAVTGANDNDRPRPRMLLRPRANRHPDVLPVRLPRADDGHLSHELGGRDAGQHAGRDSGGTRGSAVGGGGRWARRAP